MSKPTSAKSPHLDAILRINASTKGGATSGICKYGQFLEVADPELAASLEAAASVPHVSRRVIFDYATDNGYVGGRGLVSEHCNGRCSCKRASK